MSTLSGTSTDAEVWAAYDNAASYEEDDSRTKALAFRTACMILLRRRATYAMRSDQQITLESITKALEDVRAWLEVHPATTGETGNRTRYFSMENFRG